MPAREQMAVKQQSCIDHSIRLALPVNISTPLPFDFGFK